MTQGHRPDLGLTPVDRLDHDGHDHDGHDGARARPRAPWVTPTG